MRLLAALVLALTSVLSPALGSANPTRWAGEWPGTDFSRTAVNDWSEIVSGGPPRDGIPAIDAPAFQLASEEARLAPREPVIALEMEGAAARAYPVRYLMWHEIVNDHVGGVPVAVTFCPLCNSALTFDRRTEAGTLTFGVSGKLRHSDMIMFDRETESWWQQARGEAIVGELTGTELDAMPTWMESWAQFVARNPDGLVMEQPQARRAYGRNPYRRYDSADRPFLYHGENPPHGIHPLARVVRVGERAWTYERVRAETPLTEAGVTLSWTAGQASALDTAEIGEGREVGTVRVRDSAGRDVAHDVIFAFAFHALFPEGYWMLD